ncbi:hypothetical protein [Bradyrhizobium guangzhouense]|uniref:Uncharacterized protein n=1 Tax=Bradyrhizobium guangzhouense TaxID=1325095 RepID=A0AAE6C967_9BRAD|nr:hypothetical protein [Bradyrhizobium guangzhouense]QAU47215.1 hypothetical protein XH91_18905 [Bradyrhizobium guangzhouense]RXH13718.1 hypothetical protein EAS56_14070 [Bradyrhizobium guangzhouense]
MSILSKLRTLSRQQGSMEDFAEFNKQIRSEENDRGAALLAVTNADMALTQVIYNVLRPDDVAKDRLEQEGGPLQSFGQRITMGRVLGIYGSDTQHNLDLLRHIRNAFAHAHIPITFQTKEVVDAISLFKNLPLFPPYILDSQLKEAPEDPRARFHHHCEWATHNLNVWGFRMQLEMKDDKQLGFVTYRQSVPMP